MKKQNNTSTDYTKPGGFYTIPELNMSIHLTKKSLAEWIILYCNTRPEMKFILYPKYVTNINNNK